MTELWAYIKASLKADYAPIVLALLLVFFSLIYWQIIMGVPLFGDSTIHASNAKQLLEHGPWALREDYPSLYSYLLAIMYTFFGEKGFNFVVYFSFIFLLIATYLFVRQITKKPYISLLAVIFVGCSPKLIFFSARMYQEVFLCALFVYCYYLLFRFAEKMSWRAAFLLAIFMGITLSVKQQGLFILFPSIVIFFIIYRRFKKFDWSKIIILIVIPLGIGLGFYGLLFHTVGQIQPGSQEFAPLRLVNEAGEKAFLYHNSPKLYPSLTDGKETVASAKSDPIENRLYNIEISKETIATSRAESRHIWPWDPFINFTKFNQANSLYVDFQGMPVESPLIFAFSFAGLIVGAVYCYVKKEHTDLLLFTAIFLPINYLLFIRNNDQQRYQFFIPLFLIVFIFIFVDKLIKSLGAQYVTKKILITLIISMLFLTVLIPRVQANKHWANTQLYSPSVGGVASVSEVGDWLKHKTPSNATLAQVCGNEIQYYSDRKVVGDWRIYYLSPNELRSFFRNMNVTYYIAFDSQVVDDDSWSNLCWTPKSYITTLQNNFPVIYTSSYGDIKVFDVRQTYKPQDKMQ
jgi:hypothetical protein